MPWAVSQCVPRQPLLAGSVCGSRGAQPLFYGAGGSGTCAARGDTGEHDPLLFGSTGNVRAMLKPGGKAGILATSWDQHLCTKPVTI